MPDASAVKFVIQGTIEPRADRFLLSFARDNELRVRDGRLAERSKLAGLQRVGDTA
jgi:hypothetical protein